MSEGSIASPSPVGGGDGFFSTLGVGLAAGASEIFSQVLPVWAGQQLGIQKTNQLNQPLYVADPDNPRNNDGLKSTGGFWQQLTGQSTDKQQSQNATSSGVVIGGAPVPTIVLVGGAALLAGAVLFVVLK